MKKITLTFLSFLIIFFANSTYGQSTEGKLINGAMSFELKSDTLYSSTGLKIFVGQKLIIGNAHGDDGQYRSIISKKAAIVPSIWGQDKRYENAIENYVDSRKNKERLRRFLIPGNDLTIKAIRLDKTGKPHFYMVGLSSEIDECRADIKLALTLGELVVKP